MSTAEIGTTETIVHITGMTCDHCIRAVTDELTSVAGVTGVTIDLREGGISSATVTSVSPLSDAVLMSAVDEAGYDIASITRP
jgi:copper chaperone CopZ